MMDIQQQIEQKLMDAFNPIHLEVIDESHEHKSVKGSQTHFSAVIVSDHFTNKSRHERHKKVYRALLEELDGLIKSFSVLTFDPRQWEGKECHLPPVTTCMNTATQERLSRQASK